MPRRRVAAKREVLPDPIYNSQLATKFINGLMWDGKRSLAEGIFYQALEEIQKRTSDDPLKTFKKAMENVKPRVEVKSRRVGGSTYQVPIEVSQARGQALAIRWLVGYSRQRSERSMMERLANELMDAAASRGNSVKKREDTHRMADANKAFAHYRW
jgi:small subunit ribosomal protein S7